MSALDKVKVVHLAGPRDFKRTGIADYADKLVQAQRQAGIDAIFISGDSPDAGKISWHSTQTIADEMGFPFETLDVSKIYSYGQKQLLHILTDNKNFFLGQVSPSRRAQFSNMLASLRARDTLTDKKMDEVHSVLEELLTLIRENFMQISQRRNEKIIRKILDDIYETEGKIPIIHIHMVAPYCGTVVSPDFVDRYHSCVTVHELKPESRNKPLMALQYMKAASRIIIANKDELLSADRKTRNYDLAGKSSFAGIPPNITPAEELGKQAYDPARREKSCVQFTMIRPHKGIEKVLELQSIAQKSPIMKDMVTHIIGAVRHPDFLEYTSSLVRRIYGDFLDEQTLLSLGISPKIFLKEGAIAEGTSKREKALGDMLESIGILERAARDGKIEKKINAVLHINLTDHGVSDLLAKARYAYLPFERGATPHSGSLPACVSHKCVTAVTSGIQTPDEYKAGGLIIANEPSEALEHFKRCEQNPDLCKKIVEKASTDIYIPSFQHISSLTKSVYEECIAEAGQ